MSCTCTKRLFPCPTHKDMHLKFMTDVCVKTYVINVQETWPAGSTDRADIRYYTTVVEDAVRVFKSRDYTDRNVAIWHAAHWIETLAERNERKAKESNATTH